MENRSSLSNRQWHNPLCEGHQLGELYQLMDFLSNDLGFCADKWTQKTVVVVLMSERLPANVFLARTVTPLLWPENTSDTKPEETSTYQSSELKDKQQPLQSDATSLHFISLFVTTVMLHHLRSLSVCVFVRVCV